ITSSADGHSASITGYMVPAGTSNSGATAEIGVINPDGSVDTSTQIANADTGNAVKAAVSADGLGMWVATSNYIRYVPFGNNALPPTTAVSNYYQTSPSVAEIQNGTLYTTGGAGAQSNGIGALDGPAIIGNGLPTVAGQTATNTLPGFPIDSTHSFPVTNQIA